MKNRKKVITIALLLISVTAIAGTHAIYTSKANAVNKFMAADADIEIEEDFEEDDSWDGDVKSKVVQIKNEAFTDSLVRVSITPRWVDSEGNPFSGDVSENTIIFNFSEHLKAIDEVTIPSNNWVKGNDGYYYYMEKLKAKTEETESLTSVLLESVSLKQGIELSTEYNGKDLLVDVKAETVQATNHDENKDGINEYQFEKLWIDVDEKVSEKLKDIVNN